MHQLDGKLEDNFVNPTSPTTLDEIMGEYRSSRYSTNDINKYTEEIKQLNSTDLYRHAISVGIIPHDDRNRLIKNLITEFGKYHLVFNVPRVDASQYNQKKEQNVSPEVWKILREGA